MVYKRKQSVVFKTHAVIGALGLVTFLLTGQYMDLRYDHLHGMESQPRLLFRSAHIYLLFSSLLNLMLGVYGRMAHQGLQRQLQRLGSILIAVGPPLFVLAFVKEPWLQDLTRPFARPGIYAAAAGVLLHVAGAWRNPRHPE